ncbi:MAG TPA: PIN domain-containing protein [Candidatus Methylomirabilis sp.]|nr:PIN domain-containing protein [Candidatus Methylomirabilis sp.]
MRAGRVFIDTGAWFAVQVADDAHHEMAGDTFGKLLGGGRALVTSNLVIGETYTLLRVSKGYREAKRFLDLLGQSRRVDRLYITEPLERQAYEILDGFADHPFSFVDATSFAVMRQQRIQHTFAFDAHFVTAGFLRIPQDVRPNE